MQSFIASNGGLIATIILVLTIFNLFLSGLHRALGAIKDKTQSQADDQAYDAIGKVITIVQTGIDWLGMNPAHPTNPAPAPAPAPDPSAPPMPSSPGGKG